jgi:5-(carboxyamino)imidazole ribonucleotide synthase
MTKSFRQKVGVLGAGQLALMLAQASERIGVDVICAGSEGDCAERVAPVLEVDLNDTGAVKAFAENANVVTIESENIDAEVLRGLNVAPNVEAVRIAQDRLLEKQFFESCGIGVAPYVAVNDLESLYAAIDAIGVPAILKTRRMGYDGKGQFRLRTRKDAETAWSEVGQVPSILEGMVGFDDEVSMIGVRGRTGQVAFYPLVGNTHRDGILRVSVAPYGDASLQTIAEEMVGGLLEKLGYVGVLAVEFFVVGDQLLANEMAPRVHNSGHWTIEGSDTSQFENHLRAIAGMELGSTASRPTVMLNCIGTMPEESETAVFANLSRHDYGKQAREGRKVGHLTFPASDVAAIEEWKSRLP